MPDEARDKEILRLRDRTHKLENDVQAFNHWRTAHDKRFARIERTVDGMMKADEMAKVLRDHDQEARRVRLNVAQKALVLLIALVPLATLVWTIVLHYSGG